jgi:hypothetical protein
MVIALIRGLVLLTTLFVLDATALKAQGTDGASSAPCSIATPVCRSGTIASIGDSLARANAEIRPFAISEGRKSHWVAGGVVGFLVGAGATYLILHGGGSTSLCNRSANQDAMGSAECLGATALGGVAGAALGALIGSQIRSERRP